MKKTEKHPLLKATEEIMKAGIEWIAKVELRCALEGCRYGIEMFDKIPKDKCIYCGKVNLSLNDFWNVEAKHLKPTKRQTSGGLT